MEDYYEYLDSNGVTTLYKLIKDDTVALIDSYSVTINGITTNLDNHVNNTDIHTPISDIESMVDIKVSGLVNSAPETLDTLKELSDALGNDPNFATTVANQIGSKASKDDVYTKEETDTLLEGKANSVHNHVVKDITDFPTIPTKTSELSNDSNFVTSTELHDYATKNDLNSKQDALSEEQLSNIDSIPDKANKGDLSTVATSGSYKDLLDKPVLPEGADLSDYYNKGETDNLLNSKANTSDLAVVAKSGNYNDLNNIPTIPTKLSQLENDMGFGSGSGGVITSISWTNITDKPNFATVATSGSYNDLSNKPTIPKVYNKTLTIQKNGTNVATFTSNSNTDVTADITVPTKVSELSNDSGFITGISWDRITNKPTLAKVATSGSYTDLSNTPTIPTKVSQLENDTGFINTLTNVVDTKSNQTIAGTKTFTGNVYCYSLKHLTDNSYFYISGGSDWNKGANLFLYGISLTGGNAGSFELVARNTTQTRILTGYPNGTLTWNGKNIALDENLVHTSGDEYINGTKMFSNTIHRYADLTTSGYAQVYAFTDTNANGCGHTFNNVHWVDNCIHNRHGTYNNKSGKTAEIDITCNDSGVGLLYATGTATNGNLETVTPATGHTGIATMGWVNNPATSTNVVHRSGDETINGSKTFTQGINIKNSDIDLTATPTSNKYSQNFFIDKNNKLLGIVQYAQRSTDVNDLDLYVYDKNSTAHGIQITTNNELSPIGNNYSLGSSSGHKWANVYATTFNGNLKGNADTATKASYLDNYSVPNMNKIYLDWDRQVKGYVGLKVDNTVMGGLITTKNIGSQAANSATYATTQATTDNSTRIATTAWVRTYVNSVVGSNTVGSSVSAYWSNSSNVTATGQASSGGRYPSCYSDYITKTPTVGTIYSGAQLYTVLNTYASAKASTTGSPGSPIYVTNTTAQATFSTPINPSGKYLCTTANTVKFRAYTATGSSSAVGSSSVVDNTSTKSIFIRVQ